MAKRGLAAPPPEERTARLTVLIDPRKKAVFEGVCSAEDVTPSQVVRRLIRDYIESRLGHPWSGGAADEAVESPAPDIAARPAERAQRRPAPRRRGRRAARVA
jgi:hypothetical protein